MLAYLCSVSFSLFSSLSLHPGPAPRLRLVDGPHGCAGRLEVWHGGRWGSVCDDAWDLRDATVACRELGCGAALAAPGGAFFGEGAGPIFLDDLRCRGNETALWFCPSRPWSQHDCHHREDAGAVCDGEGLRKRLGRWVWWSLAWRGRKLGGLWFTWVPHVPHSLCIDRPRAQAYL